MLRLGFEVCTSVLRNLESIEINSHCKDKSLRRKVTAKNSHSKEDSMQRTFTARNSHRKEQSLQTVRIKYRVPGFQDSKFSMVPRFQGCLLTPLLAQEIETQRNRCWEFPTFTWGPAPSISWCAKTLNH